MIYILLASDSNDNPAVYILVGAFLAAFGFYKATTTRYRNMDKRFKVEESENINFRITRGEDNFIRKVKKSKSSSLKSRNDKDPTIRINGKHFS